MAQGVGISYIIVKTIYQWSEHYDEWPTEVDNVLGYYGIYTINVAEEISGIHK